MCSQVRYCNTGIFPALSEMICRIFSHRVSDFNYSLSLPYFLFLVLCLSPVCLSVNIITMARPQWPHIVICPIMF